MQYGQRIEEPNITSNLVSNFSTCILRIVKGMRRKEERKEIGVSGTHKTGSKRRGNKISDRKKFREHGISLDVSLI
jgi:hypothetical protein